MTSVSLPVVFLAFADGREDRTRYLRNLAEEARQVQQALAAAEQRGHCELVLRQNATANDILDVFQDARYRDRIAIFHFGGHADGYRLLLETPTGRQTAAHAGGLARFLAHQRGLQLVFLNACSTEGQVADLLEAGVPAVLATSQAVDDLAATIFAARFYRGLAGGASIAAAFGEAKAEQDMQGGRVFRDIGAAETMPEGGVPWRLHIRPDAATIADWSLPQAADDPLFGLPPLPPLDLPDKPYRYLDYYRREDAWVFFGRNREIRALYDRVTATDGPPIVLLYGQSGVGKSSLLAAGLLPRLEDSHEVRYARRDQAQGLLGTLAAALKSAPEADLAAAWRAAEAAAGRPLLVILDQVEELFTRPSSQQPDEMDDFLAALVGLFGDPGRRPAGKLILGFRKEWLAEIKKRLSERALPCSEVFLERLGREGVIEIVTGPARTPRLRDQYRLAIGDPLLPGLIADDLLADRESPVAPLLAILLADMWEAARARSYDRPAFDEDLYHEFRSRGLKLDDFLGRQLKALGNALPEVVDSGLALDVLAYHTTPLGTAEQRTLADLEQTYSHRRAVLPGLVQQCQDLYLLVDPAKNQPGQPPASRLAHDTLAPHVRKRFDESDAPGQRARRILESRLPATRESETPDEHQDFAPLGDADLDVVLTGQPGTRAWKAQEQQLVAVSSVDRQQRLEEKNRAAQEREEARQRELEQARKLAEEQRLRAEEGEQAARGLRKRLIAATIAALIAALAFGAAIWFAVQSQIAEEKAQHEERRARVGELAASAQVELAQTAPDHSLALLLAQEGISVTQRAGDDVNPANYRVLAEGVNAAPKLRLTLPPHLHAGPIYSIVFSPQCLRPAPAANRPCPRALLTTSEDEVARLWDPETLEQLRQFPGHDGPVFDARFSPDGSQVLTVGFDGTIRIWSVADDDRQPQGFSPPDEPLVVGFTADDRSVVTVGRSSTTRVWDAATGHETRQIPAAARARLAALSPDGTTLAVVTDQDASSALLIEVASGAVRRTLPAGQGISKLEFLSDGAKLVVDSVGYGDLAADTAVTLWDAADGRLIQSLSPDAMGALWLPNGTPVRFGGETTIGTENPAGQETPWQGVTLSTPYTFFDAQFMATGADPTGGFVAAGGSYGELYTWRLPITRTIATLGHAEGLTALAFGAGGKQLVIGGMDGRLSLWSVTTGKQVLKPFGRAFDTWVTQAKLSDDGSLAAAVTQGIGLGVWDARSGQLFAGTKFRGGDSDWPDLIQFAPGGPGALNSESGAPGLLVYGRDTQRVYLYDPRSDTNPRTFAGECESPTQMAVSRDGTNLAMDCAGQGIMVWQGGSETPTIVPMPSDRMKLKALYSGGLDGVLRFLDTGGQIWSWSSETDWRWSGPAKGAGQAAATAFSPDGNMLAAALPGGAVSLVSVASGATMQTWRHGSVESATAEVTAVVFSNDGLTLATAGNDGRVRLWDVSPGARYRLVPAELPATLPARYCAASNNDNCRVIVAAPLGRLLVWETSANLSSILDRIPISQTLLRIAPDGRYAAVQAADKRLCAWDMTTAQEAGCLPRDQSGTNIQTMAIGGTEPTLVTWDRNDLRLWRLPGLDLERRVPVTKQDTLKAAICPAAPILAVVESGVEVKLWGIGGAEAKLLHRLPSPQGDIQQITFSQDGSTLWMASGRLTSGLISRWHTATGQMDPALRLRVDAAVVALAVSPTGDRLAVGGADGMIYLWDTATGQEVTRLNAGSAAALAFNGNGRVLFSAGGQDSPVRIWPLEVSELLEQAAARISRDPPQLTGAERRRYGLSDVQK